MEQRWPGNVFTQKILKNQRTSWYANFLWRHFFDGNGSFLQERQFSTRTTKISAFRSNGRKKDHMEVAGMYIAY